MKTPTDKRQIVAIGCTVLVFHPWEIFARHDCRQRGRRAKHHIAGPLALFHRPIVRHRKRCEQPAVGRVAPPRQLRQHLRPIRPQLSVQQRLRCRHIGDLDEAVVLLHAADARRVHLPRQPLPPVQTHVNGQRQPTLRPHMNQTKTRVEIYSDNNASISSPGSATPASTAPGSAALRTTCTAPRTCAPRPKPVQCRPADASAHASSSLRCQLLFR